MKLKTKWIGLRMNPSLLPIVPMDDINNEREEEECAKIIKAKGYDE